MADDRLEKVRAEVERRMNEYDKSGIDIEKCLAAECEDLIDFIDSLEKEPRFKVGDTIELTTDGFRVEVCQVLDDRYICDSCGTMIVVAKGNQDQWKLVEEPKKCMYAKDNYTDEDRKVLCKDCEEECEYAKKEPVSEELEEAADNALSNVLNTHEIVNIRSCLEMFRFGAEWQKKQDQETIELAEDHAMFAGMEKMKEQMMAKAIDAYCFGFQGAALFSFRLPADNYLVGSEVKVIVIKV